MDRYATLFSLVPCLHPHRVSSLDTPQIACMILIILVFEQIRTHLTQIAVRERKRRGGIQPRLPHAHRAPRSPHSKSDYLRKNSSHAVRGSPQPQHKIRKITRESLPRSPKKKPGAKQKSRIPPPLAGS